MKHCKGDWERKAPVGEKPLVVEDHRSAEGDPQKNVPTSRRESNESEMRGQNRRRFKRKCSTVCEGVGWDMRNRKEGRSSEGGWGWGYPYVIRADMRRVSPRAEVTESDIL